MAHVAEMDDRCDGQPGALVHSDITVETEDVPTIGQDGSERRTVEPHCETLFSVPHRICSIGIMAAVLSVSHQVS